MSSRYAQAKAAIQNQLSVLVQRWDAGLVPEAIAVEEPTEPGHGDLVSNVAFRLARTLRRPPRAVAEELAAAWSPHPALEPPEVGGAGFLNFRLRTAWLAEVVREVLEAGPRYGSSDVGGGQRALLEFVSANPTGPLVVVNGRSAAVGDTLARLMAAAGWQVEREYYVNDAGNQIERLGEAMSLRLRELRGQPLPDPWPEGVYPGEYVRDLAQRWLAAGRPTPETVEALGEWAAEALRAEQEQELLRFGVRYDRWFSERALRRSGACEALLERLRREGLLVEADGAEWFLSTRWGDDKDRVMVKSDGSWTYFVPDAAYHADKLARGYDVAIDLLGPDHHGYIGRLKALVQALGYPAERLEVHIVQLVRLVRGGQTVRMSKRGGSFVTLGELVDEVGVDPARWFFLERAMDTPLDFDLDLAQLKSNDNPVYYVQYAAARIKSLARLAPAESLPDPDLSQLQEPEARALLLDLARFPDLVAKAAQSRAPHLLPRYLHQLAGDFHLFYRLYRILQAPPPQAAARLALSRAVLVVLERGLGLMGISVPERM
ncbi:MAG: arginine--tRNA ligase [Firmicutes bacterium]|nr:arginine--tRNA ligase [Alicyclobacillaceae bacterium]MCL6496178.1 arginine--tRNA ligase [Bacillota bacterium]